MQKNNISRQILFSKVYDPHDFSMSPKNYEIIVYYSVILCNEGKTSDVILPSVEKIFYLNLQCCSHFRLNRSGMCNRNKTYKQGMRPCAVSNSNQFLFQNVPVATPHSCTHPTVLIAV
jgi:hypothetical protein